MALDKAIASGKEHRKQYMKTAQQVDYTCRNHGSCGWCLANRLYKNIKREQKMLDRLREF